MPTIPPPRTGPDAISTQGLPHCDPSTHQRHGTGSVESRGEVVNKTLANNDLLRIGSLCDRSVDAVSATVGRRRKLQAIAFL